MDQVHSSASAPRYADRPARSSPSARRPSPPTSARIGVGARSTTAARSPTSTPGPAAAASGLEDAPATTASPPSSTAAPFVDEDFRDRKVADEWFQDALPEAAGGEGLRGDDQVPLRPEVRDRRHASASTTRRWAARMLAFNYRSIYMTEAERVELHETLVVDHYLEQFNEETIATKQQHTCGEPCAAVCKKMRGEFKKDYEPYQTMGPLCGIFDQRAAERLNHHADAVGLRRDLGRRRARLADGVPARGRPRRRRTSASTRSPVFTPEGFDVVDRLDAQRRARRRAARRDRRAPRHPRPRRRARGSRARRLAPRRRGREVLDRFVYTRLRRAAAGWCRTSTGRPGALAPMAIMGKYYMYYGADFLPPRTARAASERRAAAATSSCMDNLGICRFHRGWAEEMMPEIVGSLYGLKDEFLEGDRRSPRAGSTAATRRSSGSRSATSTSSYDVPEAAPRRRGTTADPELAELDRAPSRRTGARRRSTSGSRCARARTSRSGNSEKPGGAFPDVYRWSPSSPPR